MKRTIIILAALSFASCGTITDFRAGLSGAPDRSAPVTPTLAPVPVLPVPVLTAKERLVVAMENQGCELNKDNVGAILANATITREELLQLTPQLQSEGRVVVSGSGAIRVTSANCI